MAKRKPKHLSPVAATKSDSGLARIELFSTEVVDMLNNKWLSDQAGTSCLSLLHCVNGIITHWESLTEVEPRLFSPDVWTESEPEPDPIRKCQEAIGKYEWLRVRLPELLKRLHQPEELVAFLTQICDLDSSSLASPNQLIRHARYLDSRIVEGLEELRNPLTRFGREHELPEGWQLTGWDNHRLGMQPVRDIPELITCLKGRAVYIRHMGSSGSSLLKDELLNARLAVQDKIPESDRWPIHDYDTNDFSQSQLQLDLMIRDLSKIAARDAKTAGAVASKVASSRGHRRLEFHNKCLAKNPLLTQGQIVRMWCKESGDTCDEAAFRQSICRTR